MKQETMITRNLGSGNYKAVKMQKSQIILHYILEDVDTCIEAFQKDSKAVAVSLYIDTSGTVYCLFDPASRREDLHPHQEHPQLQLLSACSIGHGA